jgi:hypothetical protein
MPRYRTKHAEQAVGMCFRDVLPEVNVLILVNMLNVTTGIKRPLVDNKDIDNTCKTTK